MKTISVQALKAKMDNSEEFQIVDIREEYELELSTLGGEHIPMDDIMSRLGDIRKDVPVIVLCRTGLRGGNIVVYLSDKGFTNLYNLEGGINAWAENIDSSLRIY